MSIGEPIEQGVANLLALGAGGSVTVGGVTYLVSPPTKPDLIVLLKHLAAVREGRERTRRAALYADALAGLAGAPADVRALAVREAMKLLEPPATTDLADPKAAADIAPLIMEPEGAAFLLWLLARKATPGLTLEAMKSAVTVDNAADVLAQLLTASDLRAVDPN